MILLGLAPGVAMALALVFGLAPLWMGAAAGFLATLGAFAAMRDRTDAS